MNDQTKGTLITILGVLLVVPDSLLIRLITADVYTIIVWRALIAWMFMMTGLLIYYRSKLFVIWRNMGANAWGFVFFSGISGPFFAFSINLTAVANTVFILASLPVFAAFSAWVLMGQKVSRRMVWTIAFALGGILVIAYGSWNGQGGSLLGDFFAICAAATFGIALTFASKSKSESMIPFIPFAMAFAGLIFLPFATPFVFEDNNLYYALCHGGLMAVSTCFLALGPRYITSAEVALLILGESILAPLLAWAVIGEFPGYYALLGGALVLATLFISNIIALSKARQISQG